MAEEDVEFTIRARDESGGPVRKASEGLDKLGDKADKAQEKVDELGDQTGQLARKMAEAKVAAAALAREFDRTGDTKILKDFERLNREGNRLGRVLRAITPPKLDPPKVDNSVFGRLFGDLVKNAQKAGALAGDAAIGSFGDVVKAVPPEVKLGIAAGLAGAAALSAPFIAATIAGAVVAGVGAAGIGAGLALGFNDQAVAQAYTRLGNNVQHTLTEAAKPFTGDLLAAAPKLEAAFDAEAPRIKRIFSTLSLGVDPLLDGALGAVRELLPGIEAAARASVPILRSVASELPGFGRSVGNLLEAFSRAGPGASEALREIIRDVTTLINLLALGARASAPLLNALGAFSALATGAAFTGGEVGRLTTLVKASGTQAGLTAQQYGQLAIGMGNTAAKADALNDAYNRLFGAQMGVDAANLAVKQGLVNLRESIKQNGTTLDDTSQKGLNNIAVIQQQINAYDQARTAAINAGDGTETAVAQANAAYESQVGSLRALLIQLGLNAAEVDKLIGAYERIPKNITTTITTVYRTDGTPATGHSRNSGTDTSAAGGLASWAPARFAEGQRAEMRGESGGGVSRSGPPMEVHSRVENVILLDGEPFRAIVRTTVQAAEERSAWRAKVGRR